MRFLLAYHPRLCAAMRRIFVRVLLGWLEDRARREGLPGARAGAVVLTQRFGGALNANLHLHALVTDGAFTCPSPVTRAVFHPAEPREDEQIEELTCRLQRRITRYLEHTGHLPRDPHGDELPQDEPDEPLLAQLGAASVLARVALGENSGRAVTRLGRRRQVQPLSVPDEDGKVVYRLRRHWRDGTAAVAFDPLTFIERLTTLVPRPRCHQLTYHGVLAPAAQWRDLVVPRGPATTPGTTPDPSIPRLPWAELLKRVFAIDALTCPWCGGPRTLIALLTDGLVVRQILDHLSLPTEPLPLAPPDSTPKPPAQGSQHHPAPN